MPLTADQLANFRTQWNNRLFPDTGTVIRTGEGTSSDEFGLPTSGTSTVGVISLSLHVERDMIMIQQYAGQEATMDYYRLRFAYDADVESDDIVIIGGDEYKIVSLFDDHSQRMTRRALAGKVSE